MPAMKAKRRAAPPIDAPAIPPGDSLLDDAAAIIEEYCAGAEVVLPAEDDVVGGDVGVGVDAGTDPELVTGIPLGPRFSYAAQSGLGNASGQLSS